MKTHQLLERPSAPAAARSSRPSSTDHQSRDDGQGPDAASLASIQARADAGPHALRLAALQRRADERPAQEPIQRVEMSAGELATWLGIPLVMVTTILMTSAGRNFLGRMFRGRQAAGPAPVVAPWLPALHPDNGNRAADPYELQDGQVHHIISHSHLMTGLTQLDQQAQYRVRRAFLPSMDNLTIRQLATIYPHTSFQNPNPGAGVDNLIDHGHRFFEDEPWSTTPIAQLPGNITLRQAGYVDTTLANFRNAYERVRAGDANGPGNGNGTPAFWQEMLNSFFEWSGGNLFHGAQNRAEPGGADLDGFDSDASYFRDPDHVRELRALEARLRAANEGHDAGAIENVLTEIGQANRDAGPGPRNDRAQWFAPANPDQQDLVLGLLPAGARRDYVDAHAGRYLPRALLRDRARATAIAQLNAALRNDGDRADFSGVISNAAGNRQYWRGTVNAVNQVVLDLWGAHFTFQAGNGFVTITCGGLQSRVDVNGINSIAQVKDPIKNALENLF